MNTTPYTNRELETVVQLNKEDLSAMSAERFTELFIRLSGAIQNISKILAVIPAPLVNFETLVDSEYRKRELAALKSPEEDEEETPDTDKNDLLNAGTDQPNSILEQAGNYLAQQRAANEEAMRIKNERKAQTNKMLITGGVILMVILGALYFFKK